MKNVKIVLVAQWDGWCGACAADRPLVLTRTGRQHLRTWLTGAVDESRPLTLTCRLCGTGVVVPLERDDPPVASTVHEDPVPTVAESVFSTKGAAAAVAPAESGIESAIESGTALQAGRGQVAHALRALLAQRRTAEEPAVARAVHESPVQVAPVQVAPVQVAPVLAPAVTAPVLPQQRTASTGGLAELQLLADGLDLLSSGRS